MATKPGSKLDWVTDDSPAKISEPTSGKKLLGWTSGEKPPFQWFNWLFNIITHWLDYFEDFTDEIQDDLDDAESNIATLASVSASHTSSISTINGTLSTHTSQIASNTSGISTNYTAIAAIFSVNQLISITTNTTLTNKALHLADTTADRSHALPAPAAGDVIMIKDKTGTADTHPITLTRSGGGVKIEGVAADWVIREPNSCTTLVADGTDWYIV